MSVQNLSDDDDVPEPGAFFHWVDRARRRVGRSGHEVTVRLVNDVEMRSLNLQYRGSDKVTNVLSFPFETPPGLNASMATELAILGDVVISPSVVRREAAEQARQPVAHFAHLTVHGVLHLYGLDHETDSDAEEMEGIESELLQELGYPDPWIDIASTASQVARGAQ